MERIVPSGTVISYDAASGVKLFAEINRPIRTNDEPNTLPIANSLYDTLDGKTYRVVGVRKGSTELLCEIDVREEPHA
jgi:hypothetical protein